MKNTIDWIQVWKEFDSWYDKKIHHSVCKECGYDKNSEVSWEVQMYKILQLVNKQLKE